MLEHRTVHWMAHQIIVDINADFGQSDGGWPEGKPFCELRDLHAVSII